MKKIILIQFVFFSIVCFAQAPKRFYTKFGGTGVDIGYSGKPTLDKQYIVAGSTSSYGAGNTDVYLVKVDSMGVPIWEKMFGGFGNEVGKSVVQLQDSGYVVAGFTNSFGAGGYDVYLVRTDKNGNLVWQRTFGGTDWDFANDVVLTPDGDIAVVGHTSSFGAGKKDGLFLKFDLSGNLVQQKYIGGIENEELRSVIVTSDLQLASVGYTESRGEINGDCYFVKLDLNGDTLLTRCFGGPGKDYFNDVVLKSTGDFVLCGAKTYSNEASPRALMFNISPTGAFLWENKYISNVSNEEFTSVTNSYQLAVISAYARTRSVPGFKIQEDIFLALYYGYYYLVNASGGAEDEAVYSIEGLTDGGYISVGSTLSFGSIGEDVYIIRRDSTIITYNSVVGIKEIAKNKKPYWFYQNNKVNVFFQDKNGEELEVIDLNGKQIARFILKENDEKVEVDMSSFSHSIYILRIKFKDGEVYNNKIIAK